MKTGWICPRCKKSVSPYEKYCDCTDNKKVTNTTTTCANFEVNFLMDDCCVKCGQTKNSHPNFNEKSN